VKRSTEVPNADNDLLGVTHAGQIGIGYVDEVNGLGATEAPDFVPTRHELLELVKYWYSVILHNNWFFFCYQQTGSREIRENWFAGRRISRVERILGEKPVERAIEEVARKFRESVNDPEAWRIFTEGTEWEREAFSENIYREMKEKLLTESPE